jgi:Uma2 family endonuclease
MGALAVEKLSVEEYLALDRAAEVRSEYHDGQLFPAEATSLAHAVLLVNTARRLAERLDGTPCRVTAATLRVRVSRSNYVYPDVLVYCGKPALTDEHSDTITNPKVIVEILSPSTEDYDYGKKFILYRSLASFEEYLLVSQDRPRVEVSRKTPESRWVLTTYEGMDAVVNVESLGITIPMTELYAGVEFSASAE